MKSIHYDLIVFDWDGTLMDSIAKIVSSMAWAAKQVGEAIPAESATRSIIGLSIESAVAKLFPHADAGTQANIVASYREAYTQHDRTPAPLFEGVIEVLEHLKAQGYKLAVATGKARVGLNKVLESTGLGALFDATVAGDEYHSKPHPSMIHALLEQLAIAPSKTMMVGDSLMDIQMAHAAGVDSLAVGCGALTLAQLAEVKPTYRLEHTCEVVTLLQAD